MFQNLSHNGENQISLTENRSMKVTIQLDDDIHIDPNNIIWDLTRNYDKPYNNDELFPYPYYGAELPNWTTSDKETPFFENIQTTYNENTKELSVSFDTNIYFGTDISVPHTNGGYFLDVCGHFILTAYNENTMPLGKAEITILPYDDFHLMSEIYQELDDIVAFANSKTDLFVKKESMGQSTSGYDMPYLILADDQDAYTNWLAYVDAVEENPTKVLQDMENGVYDDLRVPLMFSNIHSNESSATDGILDVAWKLLQAASSDGIISYDTLTDFTEVGKAQLLEEFDITSTAIPDLVVDTASYLGFIRDENFTEKEDGSRTYVSGPVDLDKYYETKTVDLDINQLLENTFFIIVPEQNVEGRTFMTRVASNGYDLNRDNSFQTTPETQNMQYLIGKLNPISFAEIHGRVRTFQCEPCSPPHEPNFEYDLLSVHSMQAGEAFGNAAIANNDGYNSYVIPQRDYLKSTDDGGTYWESPWDDMSTSYTPQFAMLHGTVGYTIELPAYNDETVQATIYGILGHADYVAQNKMDYLKNQAKIYERGVTNANSNDYDLVGQWFADQYDIEGAEAEIFRPEFNGEGENGNFYPECYIIPMDIENQSNLKSASDMMDWLVRNDVKVQISETEFTHEGTTYPAGTMLISMYQAKRSVANSALYAGTLVNNWSYLYSEGITTFNETRGFDMLTITKPADYEEIQTAFSSPLSESESLAHLASFGSQFVGVVGQQVVLSNASEDSTSAVNALLKQGQSVSMITDANSPYYGDFLCSYDAWSSVSDTYVLSGYGIADVSFETQTIASAPKVYIAGQPVQSTTGFINTSVVTNYSWNYDRCALELMNFTTVDSPFDADVIIGAAALLEDELQAVQNGTPYIAYGSTAARTYSELFDEDQLTRAQASGMDCLASVTYPTTSLINASYVMDDDTILYGYGLGYFTAIPNGAEILVQTDSSKAPTQGFITANTPETKEKMDIFLNDSIQAFSYNGLDKNQNEVQVAFFANSLTNKVHQQDEFAFISNFIFSNLLK